LPDKIIPAPTPPAPIVSTPQIANVEPPIQFETNSADVGDAVSELAKSIAQERNEKAAWIKSREDSAEASWTNNLPLFNYSLEALYQILSEEAKKQKDGIAKTTGYFQCLPTIVGHKTGKIDAAEIRFQNKTNMDFKIVITPEVWNGETLIGARDLRIDCSSGYLIIAPHWPGLSGGLTVSVQIPNFTKSARISSPSPQDSHDIIKHYLNLLVGGQIDYLSKTNE
jgi:hypothetical protein